MWQEHLLQVSGTCDDGAFLCRCDEVKDLDMGVIQDYLGGSNLLVWLLKKWKSFPG